MDLAKVVTDLLRPLVDDPESLNVKEMESLEDEILIMVYAKDNDIGRLIGKRGAMAQAIRQTMQIPSRLLDRRITIKFESI